MVNRTKNVFSYLCALPVAVLGLSITWLTCLAAYMPVATGADGKTTKDGVYSQDQAQRGKAQYAQSCAVCHMADLSGNGQAPALTGDSFAETWNGHTADELFDLIRTTMPQNNPNSLSADQCADLIAYIFQTNSAPAGQDELKSDPATLKRITIEVKESGQ